MIENKDGEAVTTRPVTGWRMCTDFRKLNSATRKYHFPLPFINQILERLAGHKHFCYLDDYSGFLQIPIHPADQENTTFTCPYGTFAYRRVPFGLCNAPGTFQRCMMSMFSDLIKKIMEIFMDDFTVYGQGFEECLNNLEAVLKRCLEHSLIINWKKCHFLVEEGIVLGHFTTTGPPLQQRIDALPNVHICVGKAYTNRFVMRCRRWRCKGLQQCICVHLFVGKRHEEAL